MGVPTAEVGYTPAMPRREDHEVHKDMWWHWTQKHSRLNTVRDSLHGRLLGRGLWPLYSPDLTPCDLFMEKSKRWSVQNTSHTLYEHRNNIRSEISTISGQELQREDNDFRSHREGIGQEGNIFIICCSTWEFLLYFLTAIITVNLFIHSFADCYTSRDSAYDVTLAEGWPGF